MRTIRTRRRTASLAAVVTVASSLFAVSSSSGSAYGETQTLTMWARASDGFMPSIVNAFNASHADLKISLSLIPDAQLQQKYAVAASTGGGPDIAVIEIGSAPQFTSSGWLQNLTQYYQSLPYKRFLSPSHLLQGAVGNKQYLLPMIADASALFWNKTLFKEAGLDPNTPPKTWADILNDARAVRKLGGDKYGYFFSGGCAGCMGFTMLGYMWADGGDVLADHNGTVTPTLYPNPALQATLQMYRTMWQEGLVPQSAKTENGSNQFGQWFAGNIGLFAHGTIPYAEAKTQYPSLHFGVTTLPSTDGSTSASFTGGDDIGITKQANLAEGEMALSWFLSNGQEVMAKQGLLPIRSDIATKYYVPLDPRNAVFVKALQVGHIPKSAKVANVFFNNNGPFGGLIQSAIFGKASIAQDLKTAQAAAKSVLSSAGSEG
jgi:multiple sugar transport system substrate-binding protein